MAFWKRKKEPDIITLGLNRAATAEEEAIAARWEEGPEPEFYEKFAQAVSSTRVRLADRIDSVIGGGRGDGAAGLYELGVGRGAGRGRGEISVGAASLKKKKKI